MKELLNREEFTEELKNGIILVNFTKVNGSVRDMRCTLDPKYLPSDTSTSNQKTHGDRLVVWDLDADDWRSFRLGSVNHVVNPAPSGYAKSKPQPSVKKTTASAGSLKDIILSPRVGS